MQNKINKSANVAYLHNSIYILFLLSIWFNPLILSLNMNFASHKIFYKTTTISCYLNYIRFLVEMQVSFYLHTEVMILHLLFAHK